MTEFGYAGEILKIDLSARKVEKLQTSSYAGRFLGGKGLAARLYWEMAPPQAGAFSPENCFICVSGPLAGFTGLASSRWLACGRTAAGDPESFSWGNLGGSWGNTLKAAGYDGLVVQGKAEKPVYLYIHDGLVETRDAGHLWGKSTFESADTLKAELGKETSVLTIGPAAENLVVFATVLADQGASGSGGVGSIMGSKNLKAVAVAGDRKPTAANPGRLEQLSRYLQPSKGDFVLPWIIPGRTKQTACSGCGLGCPRHSYVENGRRYKLFCQQVDVYRRPALKYHNGWNDVILQATRLCDGYGLDCSVTQAMIEWLIRCYKEGALTGKSTGLPLSRIGSSEFIETLVRQIAFREGFGDLLAQGTLKAAAKIGGRAEELTGYSIMNRTNEVIDYDPRLLLHNALLIATEPRKPVYADHEPINLLFLWLNWVGMAAKMKLTPEFTREAAAKYWGSAEAGDYTTYDGKALAAKRIQDRSAVFESLVLCNSHWPGLFKINPEISGPDLAARIFSAVTGQETGEDELENTGERIFNQQRAVMLRQGWPARNGDRLLEHQHEKPLEYLRYDRDCTVIGKDSAFTSRRGAVVNRGEFEELKNEYYALRRWDVPTGLPTRAGLDGLQLADVADDLGNRGLLKPVSNL